MHSYANYMSPTLQMLATSPTVALTSVMACRVHRNLVVESLLDSEGMGGKPLTAPIFADRQVNDTLPMNMTIWMSPEPDGQRDPRGEA